MVTKIRTQYSTARDLGEPRGHRFHVEPNLTEHISVITKHYKNSGREPYFEYQF